MEQLNSVKVIAVEKMLPHLQIKEALNPGTYHSIIYATAQYAHGVAECFLRIPFEYLNEHYKLVLAWEMHWSWENPLTNDTITYNRVCGTRASIPDTNCDIALVYPYSDSLEFATPREVFADALKLYPQLRNIPRQNIYEIHSLYVTRHRLERDAKQNEKT